MPMPCFWNSSWQEETTFSPRAGSLLGNCFPPIPLEGTAIHTNDAWDLLGSCAPASLRKASGKFRYANSSRLHWVIPPTHSSTLGFFCFFLRKPTMLLAVWDDSGASEACHLNPAFLSPLPDLPLQMSQATQCWKNWHLSTSLIVSCEPVREEEGSGLRSTFWDG